MAEPATTSSTVGVYSLFLLVFGQVAGPYALIIFAALAGGLWTVGRAKTATKGEAAWLLLKTTLAAVLLTTGGAYFVEQTFGWPITQVLAPIAFIIGFGGDTWYEVLMSWIGRLSSGQTTIPENPDADKTK